VAIHDSNDADLEQEKVFFPATGGEQLRAALRIDVLKPPAGEVYSYTEAANGELGFYIVSDGSGTPYRVKCRPPCFPIFQAYPKMVEGKMLADAIAILGNLNIIAGELDR